MGNKVAIIGAGPAGISAAIQLKKEGVGFDIFERNRTGGLLWYANRVDNLLGHRGKSGKELCRMFLEHLTSFGIEVRKADISGIRMTDGGFGIDDMDYSWVILATGTRPNELGIEGELHFIEDASILKGRNVLIVGGGDIAFDNALTLKRNGAHATILHRNRPKANLGLMEEVKGQGIDLIGSDPERIRFEDGIYYLRDRGFQYLFVFIGRSPQLELLQGIGHVKVHLPSFRTSQKGLYVIGDAALGTLGQTALASGSGLAAAMDIARMVRENETTV